MKIFKIPVNQSQFGFNVVVHITNIVLELQVFKVDIVTLNLVCDANTAQEIIISSRYNEDI